MRTTMMLVVLSGLAASVAGCSAKAVEEQGSTSSRLADDADVRDGEYVESWADEDTATERANDMRSIGLSVEQYANVLYVRPAGGAEVNDMMESASSDYLMARWGGGDGGGGVVSASKKLDIQTGNIRPQGLSVQPVGIPFDGSIAGNVHVSGGITATPDISIHASSCGRGCLRLDGRAGVSIDGELKAQVDGTVKIGRDVIEVLPEIPIGKTVIVIPTPIPIPVTVSFYLAAAVACEGEVEASMSMTAQLGASGSVGFWSTMGKSQGLDAGVSGDFERHGDFQHEGGLQNVTFACGIPEVKVIARIYELGGPFISFGPKLALSSGPEGGLHGNYSFDTAIGLEAERLGFSAIKVDGPSFPIGERDF